MRVCNMDDCDRKHVARGLCGTHYNQTYQTNRHAKVEMPCVTCGAMILKETSNTSANRFCSYFCRDAHRRAKALEGKQQVVVYRGRSALGMFLAGATPTGATANRTWVAGDCRICTKPYLCKYGSTTCGAECQARWDAEVKRAGKSRRRARQRSAFVANVYPSRIYARDDYTCLLCGDPLDMDAVVPAPHAPTIDHVIPLARGGTHEPGNVQAAHFLCNALKSDRLDSAPMAHA